MTSFRDRLRHDPERGEHRDGAIRYIMIRPDALMGIFAEMPAEMREPALEAFARSIHRHGAHSARSYREAGATEAAALLRVIEETAPQLGWGKWRLVRRNDALELEVQNSPFAEAARGSPHPVCAPILGMMRAIGEMTLGGTATVAETQCAATGAGCCRFRAVKDQDAPLGAAPHS